MILQHDTADLLGNLLVKRRMISTTELNQALKQQQHNGKKLGEVLIDMGLISRISLTRTLGTQRWMRSCAASILLLSPFSMTCASEDNIYYLASDWSHHSCKASCKTQAQQPVTLHSSPISLLKTVAEKGWDIYQGEPDIGEWRYSFSKVMQDNGYKLHVTLHF